MKHLINLIDFSFRTRARVVRYGDMDRKPLDE